MTNSIRKKLIMGFSVILIIMTISTIYNLNTFKNNKNFISHIKDESIVELKYATEMKNEIIQTRLYLTDANMSNNMSALEKARQHAEQFREIASAFVKFNNDYSETINSLNDSFDKFNNYGKNMMGTYMTNGPDTNKQMMKEFDALANEVYEKAAEMQNSTQADLDIDLTEMQSSMDSSFNRGIAVTASIIILSLIIAIFISKGISTPINNLLRIFHELENGGGDLTKRINIKSNDEIGRMAIAFNKFMDTLEQMVYKIKQSSDTFTLISTDLSEGGVKTSEQITMLNDNMIRVRSDSENIKFAINQVTESILEIAASSQTSAIDAHAISFAAGDINTLSQDSSKYAIDA